MTKTTLSENVLSVVNEFERTHGVTLLYLTKYGSKLYGTDNPNSDTDYKGVFVSNVEDVLLKKDVEHWTSNTNNTMEKNSNEDVDLQLFSVHKFFELLRKGETGALDLLFSMWSDAVVYDVSAFTDLVKANYSSFLNRGLHSFTGYAVGQAKKYGVKGTRYKELVEFNERNRPNLTKHTSDLKLSTWFPHFKAYFRDEQPKYLEMVFADGPKTGKGENKVEYVSVLGKMFSGDVTFGYFMKNVLELEAQFGNRTKASAEGVDWKALSHSVRVLFEVEELLDSGFVTFPLRERDFVKEVKEGKVDVDDVMDFVNAKLDVVKEKLDTNTSLPEESNKELMDELELHFLRNFN